MAVRHGHLLLVRAVLPAGLAVAHVDGDAALIGQAEAGAARLTRGDARQRDAEELAVGALVVLGELMVGSFRAGLAGACRGLVLHSPSRRVAALAATGGAHAPQLGLLLGREFWLLTAQPALRPRDRHALPGPHPQQIDLELGEGGEDVEEHLPHRVSGVVELAAEGELDPAVGQRVTDVAGIGHRAREPVELRDDEGAALPHRCQSLIQAGTLPVGAGKSVIEIDPLLVYPEFAQPVALRGEVLLVGAAAGVARSTAMPSQLHRM